MRHLLCGEFGLDRPAHENPFSIAGDRAQASNAHPKIADLSEPGTVTGLVAGATANSTGAQSVASVLGHWAEPIVPRTAAKPTEETILPSAATSGPVAAIARSGAQAHSRRVVGGSTAAPGDDHGALPVPLDDNASVQVTSWSDQNQVQTDCDIESTVKEDDKFFLDVMLAVAKVTIKLIVLRNPYAKAAIKILKGATELEQTLAANETEQAARRLTTAYANIEGLYRPYDISYHRSIKLMEYSYIWSKSEENTDSDGGNFGGGGAGGSWHVPTKKGQDPYADPAFVACDRILTEQIAQLEQEFLQKVSKWQLLEDALNGVKEFSYESIMEDIIEQIGEAWKKLSASKKHDVICKYKSSPAQFLRNMGNYAEQRMVYKYKGF